MFEYFFIIYLFDKYKLEFNMTDADMNPLNPKWTGTSTNGGHENEEDLNALKLEMIALKAQVQVLQTENKQLVEEKKIEAVKLSKLEKEMREKLLKRKLQESQDELAEKKFRSLEEENYVKEIAELKVKNEKLTEEFEMKIKKLKEMIQTNQQKISESENEIMVSLHEMKVQLPLENWHDLLAFVPRSQLGNVVSQIGDRQFAYIIQSFLHDPLRKITIGEMEIIPPRSNVSSDQPMVKVDRNAATNMADWPMPANIKNFVQIDLNYVDTSVLQFLGKFQENSLLTDVNMFYLYEDEDILSRVLAKILPFITSIDSLASPEIDLFKMAYNNNNQEDNNKSKLLLKEMMEKTRIILANWHCGSEWAWGYNMDWFCSWLYTPRNDGKPRIWRSQSNHGFYQTTGASFVERIKKDFEMANSPVSFFIYTSIHRNDNIEDISIDNVKTNEKLVIKTRIYDNGWMLRKLLISRYLLNATKSWIEANEKEISEWNRWELNRKIIIDDELTIAI